MVDEAFPVSVATAPESTDTTPQPNPDDAKSGAASGEEGNIGAPEADEPSAPITLAAGEFASRNRYTVAGKASVHELEGGSRTLCLEDFKSTNGPDLYVYLTAADDTDSDEDLDADVVNFGRLRGNVGTRTMRSQTRWTSTTTTRWSSGGCGSQPASERPTSSSVEHGRGRAARRSSQQPCCQTGSSAVQCS